MIPLQKTNANPATKATNRALLPARVIPLGAAEKLLLPDCEVMADRKPEPHTPPISFQSLAWLPRMGELERPVPACHERRAKRGGSYAERELRREGVTQRGSYAERE
jgi:hypothetical protein